MKFQTSTLFLLTLLFNITLSSKLKSRKSTTLTPFIDVALNRIQRNVWVLQSTSCKVAAKFALLTLCNITDEDQLPLLNLIDDYKDSLRLIREKVMLGYVVHIEIKANHHFIIFKKNNSALYLLQAFQDRFKLKEWVSNKAIMAPYLTIDQFFTKMDTLLNANTSRKVINQTLIALFLPPIFTTSPELIKSTLAYFDNYPVALVKANYSLFNFGMKYTGDELKAFFHEVDQQFQV